MSWPLSLRTSRRNGFTAILEKARQWPGSGMQCELHPPRRRPDGAKAKRRLGRRQAVCPTTRAAFARRRAMSVPKAACRIRHNECSLCSATSLLPRAWALSRRFACGVPPYCDRAARVTEPDLRRHRVAGTIDQAADQLPWFDELSRRRCHADAVWCLACNPELKMKIAADARMVLLGLAFANTLFGQADAREIIRSSVAADEHNWRIARNYGFLQRVDFRRLDSRGGLKSSEVKTYDITLQEGTPYRQLVKRDDRPLPANEEKGSRTPSPRASPSDAERPRRSEPRGCQLTRGARIGSVRPGSTCRMLSSSGWSETGDWMATASS